MFNLDLAILSAINNTITYWSSMSGIFSFIKSIAIISIASEGLHQMIKIKRGDKNVSNAKR